MEISVLQRRIVLSRNKKYLWMNSLGQYGIQIQIISYFQVELTLVGFVVSFNCSKSYHLPGG